MSKTVIVAVEVLGEDNILRKRETVVGIKLNKRYTEEDLQKLLKTVIKELTPVLRVHLMK